MENQKTMSKFKAIAIGCAVILTCATAQLFAGTYDTAFNVDAATVSYTYDVEKNTDGTTVGKIKFDTGDYSTVTVKLSGGKSGATTSGEVGYYDTTTSKWVGKVYEWEEQKFDTTGALTLSNIKVPSNAKDVQIMITYYADWSSGSESLIDKSTLKIASVESGSGSSGGSTTTTTTSGSTTKPSLPANAQCGWTDITAGTTASNSKNLVSETSSAGKKTVTITQGGQWSSYDEGNEAIILDQTYEVPTDENGNQIYDTDSGNENITNSNNFMFADDFGIPTGAEINHFRFTIESEDPMYQVQLGAGISVKKGSEIANSGSTDANGNKDLIWFNESGTAPEEEGGDDYASIENANGKSYYGFNSGKDTYASGTNYIQAQWDVYDDVKSFVQNDSWSSVSVQYWYGVDPADWDLIDWENAPENPTIDPKPAQVNVTEATANYNLTQTYDYTDTAEKSLSETASVGGEMVGVSLADLGLTNNDKPKSVTLTVSGASDIGKLVGAFGVSVNDDYTGEDATDNWYQSQNLVYEDCGSTYEITWLIPEDISKYVDAEYDAEVKFGCWYAGAGENALSSLNITNVAVDYYSTPEVTTGTTPAVTTPSVTTTTATIEDGIKGDLVDLGMGPIDPADDDETSPTFHQFEIPIMDLLPETYNPNTNDVAQIVFNISSPEEMKDITGACGIAVGIDCPDATDDYWYQGDDFKVTDTGKNVTITWTVPESIRQYVQENSYGKVNLGVWYAGEGIDEVYLDSAYVIYTSSESETTIGDVTTTPSVTTTPTTTTTSSDIETTTTSGTGEDILYGDVNCDGKIKSNDLLLLKKYLLGLSDITPQGLLNADVTHDSKVKSNDLLKLKKFLLGLVDNLDE